MAKHLPGTTITPSWEPFAVAVERLRKAAGAADHRTSRGWRLVEHMSGRLRGGMSTDELMALTRGPFDDVKKKRR